jgi:hypothetical protein
MLDGYVSSARAVRPAAAGSSARGKGRHADGPEIGINRQQSSEAPSSRKLRKMFPTGLSMLWESTDPRRALQERFGLDSFDDAVSWLTKGLAQAWAIDVDACDRIVISENNAIA